MSKTKFPWLALGAGGLSFLLFFFLTGRFRIPPALGLGASLVLSTGLFLGFHRLSKFLLPVKRPFALSRARQRARKDQEELKALVDGLDPSWAGRRELESVWNSLESLLHNLGSRPEEEDLLISKISDLQNTAKRLGQMAQQMIDPSHRARLEDLARNLARQGQNQVLRQQELSLLEWESELEALEVTAGEKKSHTKS